MQAGYTPIGALAFLRADASRSKPPSAISKLLPLGVGGALFSIHAVGRSLFGTDDVPLADTSRDLLGILDMEAEVVQPGRLAYSLLLQEREII